MRARLGLVVGCATVAIPAVARADSFVTLDRQDRVSSVGIETSYLDVKDSATFGDESSTLVRFDAHAQYVAPGGVGAYVTVPVSYFYQDTSKWALGDIEVGGIYVVPSRIAGLDLVLHAGITLPTESTQNAPQNYAATAARWNDTYLAIGAATSLRLGASAIYRADAWIARVDLGVDANFSNTGADTDSQPGNTFLRFDAGAGVDLGPRALVMAELTNVYDPTGDGITSKFIASGALSVRYTGAGVHPYVAFVRPINRIAQEYVTAAITAGIDVPLP